MNTPVLGELLLCNFHSTVQCCEGACAGHAEFAFVSRLPASAEAFIHALAARVRPIVFSLGWRRGRLNHQKTAFLLLQLEVQLELAAADHRSRSLYA